MTPVREFPRDRRLQLYMALALLVHAAVIAGAVVLIVVAATSGEDGLYLLGGIVLVIGLGLPTLRRHGGPLDPFLMDDRDRVVPIVERFCAMADTPVPRIQITPDEAPLAWTSGIRRPTIHLTEGLCERLDDRGLSAVIGHELGHLANRDGVLMSVLAGPPMALRDGMKRLRSEEAQGVPSRFRGAIMLCGLVAAPIAVLLLLSSRVFCRQRELSADRHAAMLLGSPSAVAAALTQLDQDLRAFPAEDLRASRNLLHILPVGGAAATGKPWSTHPKLERRLEHLAGLEQEFQRS